MKKLKNILEDKFIFLDIDGVLSLQKQWKTRLKDLRSPFNEDCSKLLDNFLTENPNVNLIISSSWRITKTIKELQNIFKTRKFKNYSRIIGMTESLGTTRGWEIFKYCKDDEIDFKDIVIIDDEVKDIICFGKLKNRVIKTKTEIGLTEDSIKQLKEKIK